MEVKVCQITLSKGCSRLCSHQLYLNFFSQGSEMGFRGSMNISELDTKWTVYIAMCTFLGQVYIFQQIFFLKLETQISLRTSRLYLYHLPPMAQVPLYFHSFSKLSVEDLFVSGLPNIRRMKTCINSSTPGIKNIEISEI